MYALPLNVLGDLLGNFFRASDKDLLSSMLINDMVSGSLKSYDELGYKNDVLARGECLLRTKRSCGYWRRDVFFF